MLDEVRSCRQDCKLPRRESFEQAHELHDPPLAVSLENTPALRRRVNDDRTAVALMRLAEGQSVALEVRGVPFDDEPHLIARMPDHELWMTFFRDPDRNLHGLMSEIRLSN